MTDRDDPLPARYRQLELDDGVFARAEKLLVRALEGGRSVTRPAFHRILEQGGVPTAGSRGLHILGHLAQKQLLCFGPREGKQPTFVLLDEWVPVSDTPSRDDALALLARRYFTSHGPAMEQDFAWWTGLRVRDAQQAIADAGLRAVTVEGRRWWSGEDDVRPSRGVTAALLPPWDEYVVAYRDRAEVTAAESFGEARAADVRFMLPVAQLAPGDYLLTFEAAIEKTTARRDVRFRVR